MFQDLLSLIITCVYRFSNLENKSSMLGVRKDLFNEKAAYVNYTSRFLSIVVTYL